MTYFLQFLRILSYIVFPIGALYYTLVTPPVKCDLRVYTLTFLLVYKRLLIMISLSISMDFLGKPDGPGIDSKMCGSFL